MDFRIKSFESEARGAFGFLDDLGFVSSTEHSTELHRLPAAITVAFRGPDAEIETSLVLEFGGDDTVVTVVRTVDGEHKLGPRVARKGHEMRKALTAHSTEVRTLIE